MCDFLQEDNTTLVWDNEQQVPFAYRDDQWVGFDDERSLRTKVNQREFLYCRVFFNDLKKLLTSKNTKKNCLVSLSGELVERARIRWRNDLFTRYGRFPWTLRIGTLPVA